ncbi:discoidin domain-containing protein [Longitalea luteola]|uniref:discoidin domain-containing protein n=1 Tax=Longitalea luteola TaxID=2812563 RepID=UPI001A957C07|nr:discoidin domain-containing protein [Longitalea luteola]
MKQVYHWCCRTACLTAVLLVSHLTGMNIVSAQTVPDYSKAEYIPTNVGKIVPNENSQESTINPRQRTRFVYETINNSNRLPEPVAMRELYLTPTANDGIVIRWRASWEPDNLKLYEIEYSTDGIHFLRAGVLPAGNYLNGRIYEFTHFPVNARDRIFYRIMMKDESGKYDYSPILSQAATRASQNYVFPTIVNAGMVSLYLNDSFRQLQIVNSQGKILQIQQLNGKTGRIDIPLNSTAQGICFVRVLGQDRQRDIVQKIFIR